MKVTDPPIVVTAIYQTTIEKVWSAITEPAEMRQWFFEQIESFKAEVGFETQFLIENEGKKFTHSWKIVEVVPNKKLKYSWNYPEYSGDSFVIFELSEIAEGVELTLITEVLENFPQDMLEFKRESCIGGWEYFLNDRLKNYLS